MKLKFWWRNVKKVVDRLPPPQRLVRGQQCPLPPVHFRLVERAPRLLPAPQVCLKKERNSYLLISIVYTGDRLVHVIRSKTSTCTNQSNVVTDYFSVPVCTSLVLTENVY